MRFRSSQRSFVILKAAEDCCKKWRQKKMREKEQTGKHQLTGSGSCADMKCYSEIQTKTWSSVAFQIVLLNNAIKTCHLDCLTLSTPPACLIFHRTISSPSLLRTVCFPTLGSGGSPSRRAYESNSSFQNPQTSSTDVVLWPSTFRNDLDLGDDFHVVMKIFISTPVVEMKIYIQ